MSIGDIAKKIGVAKSTSSLWCRDIELTDKQIEVLAKKDADGAYLGRLRAAENRRRERLERARKLGDMGRQKIGCLSKRDLFILGVGLYWAESDKKSREVKLINSDPMMVSLWIEWLRQILGVDLNQLTFTIGINQIHSQRISDVTAYWMKITGATVSQFLKPSLKKVKNRKVYENFSEHYGTLLIRAKKATNLSYELKGMMEAVKMSF